MTGDKFNSGHSHRRNPSLFGPIVLIAIGGYFLLRNLGMLPETAWNWTAVLQLWPLWLIFLGVNVLVRQAPRPLGGFLSALVGLAAVAALGYVLIFSEDSALLRRLGVAEPPEMKVETVSYSPEDISEAKITIDLGLPSAEVYALEDSRALIDGQVSYFGTLTFDTEQDGNMATVNLNSNDGAGWLWFANPNNWGNQTLQKWELGLNPNVATDLQIDVGAGSADLNLSDLTVSNLEVAGGAGSTDLHLPGGDYEAKVDASAGSLEVWLGENGRQRIDVNGSAGSMTFYLPEGMAARIQVNDGAGSFSINQDRFTQVSGQKTDDGVWETADYQENAANSVELLIDIGAGSVRVRDY